MLDTASLLGLSENHVQERTHGERLQSEVYESLKVMKSAAAADGFDLCIASGYRSFERQQQIWNTKASGQRSLLDAHGKELDAGLLSDEEKMWAILRWSALPGLSRHHWGTDFDIYDAAALRGGLRLQLTVEETESGGVFEGMYSWLDTYLSNQAVFFRPYQQDLGGVAVEPWHLSYAPLSVPYLECQSKDAVLKQLQASEILLMNVVSNHFDEVYQRFFLNVSHP